MTGIRSMDDLKQRLQALVTDETILQCGWGSIGPRHVLVGVSDRSLILEYTTITLKHKELDLIPFGMLECIEARKGDSTLPGWAKINLHSFVMEKMTTSLILRKIGERSIHINFRSMPLISGNREAGLQIAQVISTHRPDIPTTVDLKEERLDAEGSGSGRVLRFGLVTGVLFAVPLMISAGGTGAVAGLIAGFIVGALIGIFWPMMKRTFTGRG